MSALVQLLVPFAIVAGVIIAVSALLVGAVLVEWIVLEPEAPAPFKLGPVEPARPTNQIALDLELAVSPDTAILTTPAVADAAIT